MSQPRAVWSYLLMLKFQCNAIAIWQRFVLQERVCSLYLWELHKVLPEDAIVIEHNRFYQNIIFSAPDYQLSMMETSVLGFMRFDNIGFATSALAWPHQRALQQLGREGTDCTDGTDGRSFQIRKVTRLQSYKMHTFAHRWFVHLCSIFKNYRFLELLHGFLKFCSIG